MASDFTKSGAAPLLCSSRNDSRITASWPAIDNKAWTLPIGGQVGRVVKVGGKLPVNLAVGAYYNAVRPEFGPTWQLRTQVTFIF